MNKLELTPDETNLMLQGLGTIPPVESIKIIIKIREIIKKEIEKELECRKKEEQQT